MVHAREATFHTVISLLKHPRSALCVDSLQNDGEHQRRYNDCHYDDIIRRKAPFSQTKRADLKSVSTFLFTYLLFGYFLDT